MSKYTLNVRIDVAQIKLLNDAGYKLCISKKVNDVYSVVWQATNIAYQTVFEWTDPDELQMFAAHTTAGVRITAFTNTVNALPGQTCTITADGIMTGPVGPPSGASVHVVNIWAPCQVSMNQKLGDSFCLVWVDPSAMILGDELFTPSNEILVFFSRTLKTSSTFTHIGTPSIEVKYDGAATKTVAFVDDPKSPQNNGVWVVADSSTNILRVKL